MPTLRTVTGKLLDLEGNPCTGQQVCFKLRPTGVDPALDEITLKKKFTVLTDASGCFSVDLFVSETSITGSNYTVILPDGCTYQFDIVAGVIPVDLSDLIAAGIVATKSLIVSASAILFDNTVCALPGPPGNVQEALDTICGAGVPTTNLYSVRVISLGVDDTLVDATSAEYQYIENLTGANLNLNTPAAPTTGRHYIVTNELSSTGTVTVTDGGLLSEVLAAGAVTDIIYDGTIWRIN